MVSWLYAEIDDKVKAFLARPIEDDWPYLRGRVEATAVVAAWPAPAAYQP
ncbi:hypothetical protein ACVIHI_008294 [Bradyrhizobium sp. USDA 4524]|nr:MULTISPECIES: hypothetical protein [unclassified Bradyrhizobium]MCP1838783.1 hypothetical protein [Bradyrhizobium sp. USDA 4538]MCP1899349.1 hypothetical protein [Bradyrhizobium sp. USDA 4537]MCP1986539.1 hypothetical protein [Bradyrhizobium sp. USDA 4539]